MELKTKEGLDRMIGMVRMSESDGSILMKKLDELQAVHEMLQRPKSYEEARRQVLTNRDELPARKSTF